jgi:hypothetical protein
MSVTVGSETLTTTGIVSVSAVSNLVVSILLIVWYLLGPLAA